ncbi:hypothetical protein EXIGLDRAFT_833756 [Exidia glandulosa HHB12029]|uniref:F-box domain-containing protein n=1 Tax=Exidia glandulosa HHB12029 TaxID=1314781 RepID=A0A165KFS1_EXIGL|nr:hypothetical protein EXIGLDRAFT_833756 [Exidia glandulosa HHB12029]
MPPPRTRSVAKLPAVESDSAIPWQRDLDLPPEIICLVCAHLLADGDNDGLRRVRLVNRRWGRAASSVSHANVVIRGHRHIKEFLAAILADTKRPRDSDGMAMTTFYAPDIRSLALIEPKSSDKEQETASSINDNISAALRTVLPRLVNMRRLVFNMFVWPSEDVQRALKKCTSLEFLEIRQVWEIRPASRPANTPVTVAHPKKIKSGVVLYQHCPDIVLTVSTVRVLHLQTYGLPWGSRKAPLRSFFARFAGDLTNLHTLVVNFCHVSSPELEAYTAVLRHTWPKLRHLALVGLYIGDTDDLWSFLGRHPLLEHLDWRAPSNVTPTLGRVPTIPRFTPPPDSLKLLNLRALFFLPYPTSPTCAVMLEGLLRAMAPSRPLEKLMIDANLISRGVLRRLLGEQEGHLKFFYLYISPAERMRTSLHTINLLNGSNRLEHLDLGFPVLCVPSEEVLHSVLKFVQGLKSLTITVQFDSEDAPPVADASNELLTRCVRHCRSLRRFTVYWIRYQEQKSSKWAAHSFFVRRIATWTDVTENRDGILSLADREDVVEGHEPMCWDDARPGCPSFSQIPSFF